MEYLNYAEDVKIDQKRNDRIGKENKMDNKKKIDKPDCWNPNNDPYPLCKGNADQLHECRECCLYEDMDEKAYDDK